MSANHLGSKKLIAAAAVGLLAAALGACSSTSAPGSGSGGSSAKSNASNTLTMESSPETTITDDFNPFVSTAAPQGMGATGLIYEPLLQFNLAAPPKYYPWLATAYTWSNGGKSVTFAIRQGVKCGTTRTPMTPADVVFTYQLVQKNAAINLAGLPITSVSSSGNNVTISFSSPQYLDLQQIAGVPILPKAVWATAGSPTTFTDPKPVGTGPYVRRRPSPAGLHADEEHVVLAGVDGEGTERVLPRLHLQHRRAVRRCTPEQSTGPVTSSPASRRTSSAPHRSTTTSGRHQAARTRCSRTSTSGRLTSYRSGRPSAWP